MEPISTRKEQVLRAVIIEYVRAAEPVSSDHILKSYELGVRSATIRNELSELADLGLLEQPHTSAGRIPSDQGYRYFVDRLMVTRNPGQKSKERVESAAQREETLKELLRDSTRILSQLLQLCCAAATLKDSQVRVQSSLVTALGADKVLMVLMTHSGMVENRILECPPGLTLEDIGRVNAQLNEKVTGRTLGELAGLGYDANPRDRAEDLYAKAASMIRAAAEDLTRGHLITEGEEYILAQPEFQRDPGALEMVVRALEQDQALRDAVIGMEDKPRSATIGREHKEEALQKLSMVRRMFYVGEEKAGALAIIGPTRMNYERSSSLLDYTARAITQTLTRLFG